MSQPQTRMSRPINNMPMNRKARRRLALTSALNNPTAATFSDPMPVSSNSNPPLPDHSDHVKEHAPPALGLANPVHTAPPKVGNSKNKRKRQRTADRSPETFVANGVHVEAIVEEHTVTLAGPSSRPLGTTLSINATATESPTNHVSGPSPTIQQQMQDRSKLLAAQEGNARLEAQVETLGKEVAFKNDVRIHLLFHEPLVDTYRDSS